MNAPRERSLARPPMEAAGPTSLDDTFRLAEVFAKSGFFSDTKEAAQCVTKMIAGAELGFGPVASMVGVYIVKGKVSLSANLIGAAIKRSGRYNYRVRELSDTAARLEFFEGGESVGLSVFTLEDARIAGLLVNQTWKQYPRNMLFARALSNGARWYVPDVFGGPIYTPEELGAPTDADGVLDEPRQQQALGVGRSQAIADAQDAQIAAIDAKTLIDRAAATAEADAGITEHEREQEPAVTETTRLACAAFVDEIKAANPKLRITLPADAEGDIAWRRWLLEKQKAWAASPHNAAATATPLGGR